MNLSIIENNQTVHFEIKEHFGKDGSKGEKGDKGDPFRYEDLTPEQLLDLRGNKLVAEYIHQGNKEIHWKRYNNQTGTFFAPNHGLRENDTIYPILNESVLYNRGRPEVFSAMPLQDTIYYAAVINENEFKLKNTWDGRLAPPFIMSLSSSPKWHFEQFMRNSVLIRGFPPMTSCRVEVLGKIINGFRQNMYMSPPRSTGFSTLEFLVPENMGIMATNVPCAIGRIVFDVELRDGKFFAQTQCNFVGGGSGPINDTAFHYGDKSYFNEFTYIALRNAGIANRSIVRVYDKQ